MLISSGESLEAILPELPIVENRYATLISGNQELSSMYPFGFNDSGMIIRAFFDVFAKMDITAYFSGKFIEKPDNPKLHIESIGSGEGGETLDVDSALKGFVVPTGNSRLRLIHGSQKGDTDLGTIDLFDLKPETIDESVEVFRDTFEDLVSDLSTQTKEEVIKLRGLADSLDYKAALLSRITLS